MNHLMLKLFKKLYAFFGFFFEKCIFFFPIFITFSMKLKVRRMLAKLIEEKHIFCCE